MIAACSGCSTLSKTVNYEIEPSPSLKRTFVSDWCEENQAALGVFGDSCFGIYNPPVYSYKIGDGYVVIYPALVSHAEIAAGPLGLPVIPLGNDSISDNSERKLFLRFRTYSKSENSQIQPLKVTILDSDRNIGCDVYKYSVDEIGDVFLCKLIIKKEDLKDFTATLTLSNRTDFNIAYRLKVFTSYRPVVAPNGPDRKVKPFIVIRDK